jgi:AAA domain, putative AbiEii toxin, Type IV TA system
MISQGFASVYKDESEDTTIGEFRRKTIGDIRASMKRLFGDLTLNDFGDPLEDGTFFFDKGTSKRFPYQNLSGGEKAAFDLILDIIVKRKAFNETVYCIDEPEAHMNPRLQAKLLEELFKLVPDRSQLWLATHSIGMMRRARDLYKENSDQVVFLDFGKCDFDSSVTLEPEVPDRRFWDEVLNVALDDFASLVAPETVVLCEGEMSRTDAGFDASCYEAIFCSKYPSIKFLGVGNCHEVEGDRQSFLYGLSVLLAGSRIIRLIDRDDHSKEDVAEKKRE